MQGFECSHTYTLNGMLCCFPPTHRQRVLLCMSIGELMVDVQGAGGTLAQGIISCEELWRLAEKVRTLQG